MSKEKKDKFILQLVAAYKALGGGWQIRYNNEFVPAQIREEMRNRTNWGKMLEAGNLTK